MAFRQDIPADAVWNDGPPKVVPPGTCPLCGVHPLWGATGKCKQCHNRGIALQRSADLRDSDLLMPPSWSSLPESTDPRPDLLWAYNNHSHVVHSKNGKQTRIFWARMTQPPTRAASAQIIFFASNPTKFQERLDKAFGKSDDSDPEMVKQERKSIAEVRKVLEAFSRKKGE